MDRTQHFSARADARDPPRESTEKRLGSLRPVAFPAEGGDGSAMARPGGHPSLPLDAPGSSHPFVASFEDALDEVGEESLVIHRLILRRVLVALRFERVPTRVDMGPA